MTKSQQSFSHNRKLEQVPKQTEILTFNIHLPTLQTLKNKFYAIFVFDLLILCYWYIEHVLVSSKLFIFYIKLLLILLQEDRCD